MNGAVLAANPVITALCGPRPRLRTRSTGSPGIGLRVVADGGRSIVIRLVIADQHARRRSHRGSQRRKRRNDVAAFIVNWDDDVEPAVITEPAA